MANGEYSDWTQRIFGTDIPVPGVLFATSFAGDTTWGQKANIALLKIELEYVDTLLASIRDWNVRGAVAEFGIFEGWWVNHLYEATERLSLFRPILGFDSFQGLSTPHAEYDVPYWQEGAYAASRALVEQKVNAAARPRIQLIGGYFANSLVGDEALAIGEIAYARIDCDIYEPAKQCLQYLSGRLTHGAILVFDEWPHRLDVGEGRAFAEWVPTVPHLDFEFLFFGTWGHFYIRVWHRNRPRYS